MMIKKLLFAPLFLLYANTFAQSIQATKIDSLLNTLHHKEMFNGNVLVAKGGKVIYRGSRGMANVATGESLNPETIFELASVSKAFTAMAVVLLEKRGKLAYDDLMSKYIPELSDYGNINIKHLLLHTSGLPDYMDLFIENWDKSHFVTNETIVTEFVKYKPVVHFKPGERFEYSNTGYALLALIIERVAKESFVTFLKNNIFDPLGMLNTSVYRSRYAPRVLKNYAVGYVTDSLGNKVAADSLGKGHYYYYLDGVVGDGMVNSTLDDLFKWDRALYTEQLVNTADKALIFQSGVTATGEKTDYGFGWEIGESKKYGRLIYHSGGWAGYETYIGRQIDHDATIIVLQNNSTFLTYTPKSEIRKIICDEPLHDPILKSLKLTDDMFAQYIGNYFEPNIPLNLNFFKKGDLLMLQADGQHALPLDAYEDHTFRYDPANIQLTFDLKAGIINYKQGKSNFQFMKKKR
ncbi:serine hydrolase domain-containing protein [Sphingobacterium sp. WOUb80]|uniref:serine hydrolase domain-containing protein n=1 Tax=Sphingobacterium sp. WOUb80 TaxID=3234028 RepID=UPI003CF2846C